MTTKENAKKRYRPSKFLIFIVLVIVFLLIASSYIYITLYSDDHFHQGKYLNEDILIDICTFQKNL